MIMGVDIAGPGNEAAECWVPRGGDAWIKEEV